MALIIIVVDWTMFTVVVGKYRNIQLSKLNGFR